MRDVALLALLYGVSDISKIFNLEEHVLISWMHQLRQDPFFKSIRRKIMNISRDIDISIIARKYSMSQSVVNHFITHRDRIHKEPTPATLVIDADEDLESVSLEEFSSKNTKKKEISFNLSPLIMDEWFPSMDDFLFNILANINASFQKPFKKVKMNVKESMIAEVIREGTPLYRETALKYGLRPEKVKEWVQNFQNEGIIKEPTYSIREASSILQRAYRLLIEDS